MRACVHVWQSLRTLCVMSVQWTQVDSEGSKAVRVKLLGHLQLQAFVCVFVWQGIGVGVV